MHELHTPAAEEHLTMNVVILEDDPAKTTPQAEVGFSAVEAVNEHPGDLIECLLHTAYACNMDPVRLLLDALTRYQDHVQRTQPEPDFTDEDWRARVANATARLYTVLYAPGERVENNYADEILGELVGDILRLAERWDTPRNEVLAHALLAIGDDRRAWFK